MRALLGTTELAEPPKVNVWAGVAAGSVSAGIALLCAHVGPLGKGSDTAGDYPLLWAGWNML